MGERAEHGGINGRGTPFLFLPRVSSPCRLLSSFLFLFCTWTFFNPSTYVRTYTTISTVISLHCPHGRLDSIRFGHSDDGKSRTGGVNSRVNTGVSSFFCRSSILSFLLFAPTVVAVASIASISSPPFFPSFLFFFLSFFFFLCIVPLPSPSTSVGVNLSPRLSPNPELYKLKPISLPGLRSSYSKPLYFRLFVVGKHARSSSRRSARTRCLATTLHLLLVHPHTHISLFFFLLRPAYTRTRSDEFV